MKIEFKRKAKASWSDGQIARVKVATRWAASRLGFTYLPITIVVRLVGPHPEQFGSCSMVDEDRYIIWLQSGLSADRTISTLFHEMTHVKQHLFEGLELHSDHLVEYQNKQFELDDYWESPWEVSARRAERRLLKEFLEAY